jgi:hypothetical protein
MALSPGPSLVATSSTYVHQKNGPPLSEADHFFKCDEACGGWFDMPDLGAVLVHEDVRSSGKRKRGFSSVPKA